MIKLCDLSDKQLSKGIKSLSPLRLRSNSVKNKLLDGTYHIQTIGTPLKYFTFEILSNEDQVNHINSGEANGEDFKLIIDDKYYIGKLENEPDWNRLGKRYKDVIDRSFTTSMIFIVSEEGSI